MRIARPRVLFIAPTLPALTGNGLAMRMGVFAEALARWADVDLAVVPVAGGGVENTPFLHSLDLRLSRVSWDRRPDTHYTLLSRVANPAARLQTFRAYGKPTIASTLTARVAENIRDLAGEGRYDLIHIGRSYMIPLARFLPETTPVTLDLDEDDRASFASRAALARGSGNCFLADWLDQEGHACDGLIAAMAGRLQRAFAASVRECENLARRHPEVRFETVPNAVKIPRHAPRIEDGRSILFVGSLGYEPNADSILWFARTIMPRLRTGFGRCRLTIVGANPPSAVRALARHPDIRVLGFVDDLTEVYRRASLLIAPMQAGGGTRIKVLEAAAFGVATVASPPAAAGLFTPRQPWGWICQRPSDFVAACADALSDPRERDRRGKIGYRSVTRQYSRDVVVPRLAALLHECCG
jgi:glycosyltransferase involved in cell wall biosynthesis